MNKKKSLNPSKNNNSQKEKNDIASSEKPPVEDVEKAFNKLDTDTKKELVFKSWKWSHIGPLNFEDQLFSTFLEKCSKDDMTILIKNMEKDRIRQDNQRKRSKVFNFARFSVFAAMFVFLVVFLTMTNNNDLLSRLLQWGLAFLGGGGSVIIFLRNKKMI